jgi:hypothetical protein
LEKVVHELRQCSSTLVVASEPAEEEKDNNLEELCKKFIGEL